MLVPLHTKAFSRVYWEDPRVKHIEQYKQENIKTRKYLAEIAAAKVELIDKTPFDIDEQNLTINRISCLLNNLYALIQK